MIRALPTRTVRRLLSSAASRVLLADGAQLEPRCALELSVPVPAADGSVVRMLDIFLVRDEDDVIHAYENHCPHAGGPLNLLPNRFLSRDKKHLLCATHGAFFKISGGACVRGPCVGKSLNPLPVHVDPATGRITASEEALLELCEHGGGAYMEVPVAENPPG